MNNFIFCCSSGPCAQQSVESVDLDRPSKPEARLPSHSEPVSFPTKAKPVIEDKDDEKARLQKAVKDFAKSAVAGMAVLAVHSTTGIRTVRTFQMDRQLSVFCLKGGGWPAEEYPMKQIDCIREGREVEEKYGLFGIVDSACVAIEMKVGQPFFFCFDDEPNKRANFAVCMKILRMSVDLGKSPSTT